MNAKSLLVVGLAAGALLPLAPGALAQAPATAPAAPPLTYGPAIPGFCVFSEGAIIENSKVGQSVLARMKMLKSAVDAELQPQADQINIDKKALDAQASTLDQASLQARGANLQLRYTNFQKTAQLRGQELQQTQEKEVAVVEREMEPILRQLFVQKQCSILVERESGGVRVANPAMDLSVQTITALDLKIQTLTFDRVHLDTEPGAAPAGAR